MTHPKQVRRLCFTVNNPTASDDPQLLPNIRYLVWQLEPAPSTGTPHFQGFVCFSKLTAFSTIKKSLPRAHFIKPNGSVDQNTHYCTKPVVDCQCKHCKDCPARLDGPWTRGSPPAPGTRSDLARLKDDLDTGTSLKEVSEQHFSNFLRYKNGILAYRLLHSQRRTWKTEVTFMFGPRNSGKTYWVHQLAKRVFVKPHKDWCTGFDQHTDVLLDEFTSTKYGSITFLNQLLDKYPYTPPVHGGIVNWNPRRLWITSNLQPAELFPTIQEKRPELVRAFWNRVEWIVKFDESREFRFIPSMYIAGDQWVEGFKRK